MNRFQKQLFILVSITAFSCSDDEPEPPICGILEAATVPQLDIYEPLETLSLLNYQSNNTYYMEIDVVGLPDGITFNEDSGRIEGASTEPGTFTVTISAVQSDDRCPAPESITTMLTVSDRAVECDDSKDCNLIFTSGDGCVDDSTCLNEEKCFDIYPGRTTCMSVNSICGDGTTATEFELVTGGTDSVCTSTVSPYQCNTRGHCVPEQ